MQEHAAQNAPLEACWLVSGRIEKGSFQALDLIPSGLELVAIYHSHPHGPEVPSHTDIKEAYYPDSIHLIWSASSGEWNCRGFLIHSDAVREVRLFITM